MIQLLLSIVSATCSVLPCRTLELDRIPLVKAGAFHGKLVRSTFVISCPPDTHGKSTIIGTGNNAVERSALVPKDLMLDKSDEVTVVGVLEVIPTLRTW
jgi:hypothetical protein